MKITTILTISLTLGIFYLLSDFEQNRLMEKTKKAEAVIISKSGSVTTGTVSFSERDGLVTMKAIVKGATPGDHAIHIHAEGDCTAEDGSSAGGHWNPTEENHGKWNSDSFHRGDIGERLTCGALVARTHPGTFLERQLSFMLESMIFQHSLRVQLGRALDAEKLRKNELYAYNPLWRLMRTICMNLIMKSTFRANPKTMR